MPEAESFALPLFLNTRNKTLTGWIVAISASVLYLLSNHIHLVAPVSLPVTAVDRAIPFVPWTIWLYVSEYLVIVLLYVISDDHANANKFAYAFTSLYLVCVPIFMAWPTTYPREVYPMPADLDAGTRFLLTSIRQLDTPANCCPSLHVGSIYLAAFLFLAEHRRKLPAAFVIATAIALSTLTTKQHYVIDVVFGFLLGLAAYVVFFKLVRYRPVVGSAVVPGRDAR